MEKIIEIDATNAIEKIKLGVIKIDKINFNLFPEIIIHHHDELVESKGLSKHFKRHIDNPKLREFIYFIAKFLVKHQVNSPEFSKNLMKQMDDSKVITQNDFDKLLNNIRKLIEIYDARLVTIDTLIINNNKAENVLTALKNRIQKGIFFSDLGERFFQFCQLEYEKNKIYETGIVPLGWLPSDVSDMSSLLEKLGISLEQNDEMTKRLRNNALGNSMLHMSGR
jgi:hypothetical protein